MRVEFIKIKSIQRKKTETLVYDLTVKKNHNFFTNIGLVHNCNHACKYCYADAFRASLYTSFFDNVKEMGLRFCSPNYFEKELDKLMKFRGTKVDNNNNEIQKAISMEMPIRFGIRFEDFLPPEREKKISLQMLRHLRRHNYPVMINTKSDLIGEESYVRELVDNKGKAAVHITMISNNEAFLKEIEPGAPSFRRRITAAKNLSDAGVKVVARIEPFMVFLTDNKEEVDEYLEELRNAGIKSLTFDTYSYSAYNPGIRMNFLKLGYDFDRMFLLMSDCQWLGSLLLGKFMEYVRWHGFNCSTFDFGNVPTNDDNICCEVGKWFGKGFCYGNAMSAIRFISMPTLVKEPARWSDFVNHVNANGGFLSESLKAAVKQLWNLQGNNAYSLDWAAGLHPVGFDQDGLMWEYNPFEDFRIDMLKAII